MRNLPQLLRDAERRVNAHVFHQNGKGMGRDSHLASIPANRDTDTDLLLIEAANRIEKLEAEAKAAPKYPHMPRPERNHDYRSPQCWCGEMNHASEADLPRGKCDRCGRPYWKAETTGKIDEAANIGGRVCGGTFVETKSDCPECGDTKPQHVAGCSQAKQAGAQ